MAQETLYVYTCDKDGTATEPVPSSNPPLGWTRLTVQETVEVPPGTIAPPMGMGMGTNQFLCPACTTAFKTFMES